MGRTSTTNILKPAVYVSKWVCECMGMRVCAGGKCVWVYVCLLTLMWQREGNRPFNQSVIPLTQVVCVCVCAYAHLNAARVVGPQKRFVLWWLKDLAQTELFTASTTHRETCKHPHKHALSFIVSVSQKCTRKTEICQERRKVKTLTLFCSVVVWIFQFS